MNEMKDNDIKLIRLVMKEFFPSRYKLRVKSDNSVVIERTQSGRPKKPAIRLID